MRAIAFNLLSLGDLRTFRRFANVTVSQSIRAQMCEARGPLYAQVLEATKWVAR